MKLYTNQIPGTAVSYTMVPIHGGEFLMGSPNSEKGRKPDEGPQHKVKISPFWMGQCEVTWNEYELFMYPDEEKRIRATMATNSAGDDIADAITHPSKPYVEMSFGMGKDGFPAISMTQHAANKYCQWLSAKTGEFYRLPTEAEWEYACRAGAKDPMKLDKKAILDMAWTKENADDKTQPAMQKKPNAWGLYDMLGNVAEWVTMLDDTEAVAGGSFKDDAEDVHSAAREAYNNRIWQKKDPQSPQGRSWLSDGGFVGFRIVRDD
jgi:formylglycine-generating enzyme required for sulfatase activity